MPTLIRYFILENGGWSVRSYPAFVETVQNTFFVLKLISPSPIDCKTIRGSIVFLFHICLLFSQIVAQLKQWAEDSPVAKWIDITDGNFTAMENPIYMMIVDDPSSGQIVSAKQTVMIVAGRYSTIDLVQKFTDR